MGSAASASMRRPRPLQNSSTASASDSVAPEPPMKTKDPIRPPLSAQGATSPLATAAALASTAWSSTWKKGCMA